MGVWYCWKINDAANVNQLPHPIGCQAGDFDGHIITLQTRLRTDNLLGAVAEKVVRVYELAGQKGLKS